MSNEQKPNEAEEASSIIEELQEALENESHPQYEEAVRQNRVLAKSLAPELEALRKSVAA